MVDIGIQIPIQKFILARNRNQTFNFYLTIITHREHCSYICIHCNNISTQDSCLQNNYLSWKYLKQSNLLVFEFNDECNCIHFAQNLYYIDLKSLLETQFQIHMHLSQVRFPNNYRPCKFLLYHSGQSLQNRFDIFHHHNNVYNLRCRCLQDYLSQNQIQNNYFFYRILYTPYNLVSNACQPISQLFDTVHNSMSINCNFAQNNLHILFIPLRFQKIEQKSIIGCIRQLISSFEYIFIY